MATEDPVTPVPVPGISIAVTRQIFYVLCCDISGNPENDFLYTIQAVLLKFINATGRKVSVVNFIEEHADEGAVSRSTFLLNCWGSKD